MIVYAIYVLTKDGLELISEKFQSEDSVPNTTLLAALLIAFQQMAESVTTIGIPRKICFDELTYHVQSFGAIQVVVVTNTDDEPKNLLSKLGWQFLYRFKIDYPKWNGNQTMFEPFRNKMNELASEHATIDKEGMIKPGKFLDQFAFMSLPKNYQTIAGAINVKSSTLSELLEEVVCSRGELIEGLAYLKKAGYVGIRSSSKGVEQYFTLAGELT